MVSEWVIEQGLKNFGLVMLILAIICILLHYLFSKTKTFYEITFRWITLLPLGVTGIYTAIMHVFFAEITAAGIGWATSPFQFEVGMADLTIGILGILAFSASYSFRLATTIGATIWLWGDAVGHIYQMFYHQNFAPGNAGSWFWMDIIVPLILLICLQKISKDRRF